MQHALNIPVAIRATAGGSAGVPRAQLAALLLSLLTTLAAAQCAPSSLLISLSLYGINGTVCQQSPGTTHSHSFTIDNPTGAGLLFYSTDGADCTGTSPPPEYYASPYSNVMGTFSKLITVNGAPCRSAPCCALVFCVRSGGAFDAVRRAHEFAHPPFQSAPRPDPDPPPL